MGPAWWFKTLQYCIAIYCIVIMEYCNILYCYNGILQYIVLLQWNIAIYGTVSAKIAPRLKWYKNASRLNRYKFPTDNAIDFLFSTLHTTPFHYDVLKIESR